MTGRFTIASEKGDPNSIEIPIAECSLLLEHLGRKAQMAHKNNEDLKIESHISTNEVLRNTLVV